MKVNNNIHLNYQSDRIILIEDKESDSHTRSTEKPRLIQIKKEEISFQPKQNTSTYLTIIIDKVKKHALCCFQFISDFFSKLTNFIFNQIYKPRMYILQQDFIFVLFLTNNIQSFLILYRD